MKVIVITNNELKQELLAQSSEANLELQFAASLNEVHNIDAADGFIDLLFEANAERVHFLKSFRVPVVINSVTTNLQELKIDAIRINGWPSFLKSAIIEASAFNATKRPFIEELFAHFNKKIEWLPDEPGFVTPRVVSSIINEAYFALDEGVSTKEEIDTAMKLGTAYPFGPFEWARKIGLRKVAGLLSTLSPAFPRYTPSPLLLREAERAAV